MITVRGINRVCCIQLAAIVPKSFSSNLIRLLLHVSQLSTAWKLALVGLGIRCQSFHLIISTEESHWNKLITVSPVIVCP